MQYSYTRRGPTSATVHALFQASQTLDHAAHHPALPGEEIQRIARPAADSRVGGSYARDRGVQKTDLNFWEEG